MFSMIPPMYSLNWPSRLSNTSSTHQDTDFPNLNSKLRDQGCLGAKGSCLHKVLLRFNCCCIKIWSTCFSAYQELSMLGKGRSWILDSPITRSSPSYRCSATLHKGFVGHTNRRLYQLTNSMQTVSKWKSMIAQSQSESIVLDTPAWLARTTLDAIGKG